MFYPYHICLRLGPLTSSFFIESSCEYLNEYSSTRVLVNTESTLIQAANDKEGAVGQRTWGPRGQGLEQASSHYTYMFRYIYRQASCKWNHEDPSFHKFQAVINWLQKTV